MRLDVAFARPLTREQRTVFLLVVSAMANTTRIAFVRGDHGAVVAGEALSAARLREVLVEEGLVPESISSSVDAVGEASADGTSERATRERVRPIGR